MTVLEFRGEDHAKLKKLADKAVDAICEFKEALMELGEEFEEEEDEVEFRGGSMNRRSGSRSGVRNMRRNSRYNSRYDY